MPTNFARIAQDMGAVGIRVEKPGDIAGAIQQALSEDAPVVVEVLTDENAKAPFLPAY
jgi:acetolactate synthase-1/2/3 large subunit